MLMKLARINIGRTIVSVFSPGGCVAWPMKLILCFNAPISLIPPQRSENLRRDGGSGCFSYARKDALPSECAVQAPAFANVYVAS